MSVLLVVVSTDLVANGDAGVGVLPLLGIAALPDDVAVLAFLAAVGIGNALVDVGLFTLPARSSPTRCWDACSAELPVEQRRARRRASS